MEKRISRGSTSVQLFIFLVRKLEHSVYHNLSQNLTHSHLIKTQIYPIFYNFTPKNSTVSHSSKKNPP